MPRWTICPGRQYAPVDNMPRWTICPMRKNAPTDNMLHAHATLHAALQGSLHDVHACSMCEEDKMTSYNYSVCSMPVCKSVSLNDCQMSQHRKTLFCSTELSEVKTNEHFCHPLVFTMIGASLLGTVRYFYLKVVTLYKLFVV